MRSDLFLFFGILIFIFVVWVATGGPSRPISFSGPFITPLTSVGGTATSSTGYRISNGGGARSGARGGSTANAQQSLSYAQENVVDLQKSLADAAHFGTASTLKGLVTFSHDVSPLRATDAKNEYLTITVSTRATTGISISGWHIYSERINHALRIPEGVNLPHSAEVNQTAPIVLAPGQSAIISVGTSPVGMSFRQNMCTGYFDQFQNFTPYIPHVCPLPSSDFARFYLGNTHSYDVCKAFIQKVPQCTVPLDVPNNIGTDCWTLINNDFNYNGCVTTHLGDQGFFGNTWRVYLGEQDAFFTQDHDTIKLLDTAGHTVDAFSY